MLPEAGRSETGLIDCGEVDPWVRKAILEGKCPNWVPEDKCKDFNGLMKDSIVLSEILCSGWKIEKAEYDGETLVVISAKHIIRHRQKIGSFKNIENVKVVGNRLFISYKKGKLSHKEKAMWGGGGFISGVITILLFMLLI